MEISQTGLATSDFPSARPPMDNGPFSVRWSGMLRAPDTSQNYSFSTASQGVIFSTAVGCQQRPDLPLSSSSVPPWFDELQLPAAVAAVAPHCPSQVERVKLWVDNSLLIDQWTSLAGTIATASPLSLIADRLYDIKVEYKNSVTISQTGLTIPFSLIGDGFFSVRWSGMVCAPDPSQNISFSTAVGSDAAKIERVRLWIDNSLIIDQWTSLRWVAEGRVPSGNKFYNIKVEYKNFVPSGAKLALKWEGSFQPVIVTSGTPPALTPKTTSAIVTTSTHASTKTPKTRCQYHHHTRSCNTNTEYNKHASSGPAPASRSHEQVNVHNRAHPSTAVLGQVRVLGGATASSTGDHRECRDVQGRTPGLLHHHAGLLHCHGVCQGRGCSCGGNDKVDRHSGSQDRMHFGGMAPLPAP